MSRSRKKEPWAPNACCNSNKKSKQANNRLLRHKAKLGLECAVDHDSMVLPEKLESAMDRWDYGDDGKSRMDVEALREDGWQDYQIFGK